MGLLEAYVLRRAAELASDIAGKASSEHTHTADDITGLSAVALSGAYADLTGTPQQGDGGSGPTAARLLTAAASVSNTTGAQPWFPSSGAVAVDSNKTYAMLGILRLLAGTTSHSLQIGFGGTASVEQISYIGIGVKRTMNQAGTTSQMAMSNNTSLTTITSANTTGGGTVVVLGVLRTQVQGGGTLIPQFGFSAAPGGSPAAQFGTYFELRELGDGSITTIGTWS